MPAVPTRLSRRAATAALAAAAMLGAVAPAATAQAAAPVAPAKPTGLTVALGAPAPHGPLLPGGRAETFTVTASNPTAKPLVFSPEIEVNPQGVIGLLPSDVKMSVSPVHAPATSIDYHLWVLGRKLVGSFFPKGGTAGSSGFTVPAHARYSWKFSVAAGKTWQPVDNALTFTLDDAAAPPKAGLHSLVFKVGRAHTGGGVSISTKHLPALVMNKWVDFDLSLTNHTGARLTMPLRGDFLAYGAAYDRQGRRHPGYLSLAYDLETFWGGHWIPAHYGWGLPTLRRGLADGATFTWHVRVRLRSADSFPGLTTKAVVSDSVVVNYDYPSSNWGRTGLDVRYSQFILPIRRH